MRHHRIALITAAALVAAPFAPVPAQATDALPARAVRPADVPAPAVTLATLGTAKPSGGDRRAVLFDGSDPASAASQLVGALRSAGVL